MTNELHPCNSFKLPVRHNQFPVQGDFVYAVGPGGEKR